MTPPKNRLVLTPEERTGLEIARKYGVLLNYPGAAYYVAAARTRRNPLEYVHAPVIQGLVRKGLLQRVTVRDDVVAVIAAPVEA